LIDGSGAAARRECAGHFLRFRGLDVRDHDKRAFDGE
jgi:hypothetical protein